jgi:hypothetical protein
MYNQNKIKDMNKLYYLVIALLMLSTTGCDDFIDRSPISQANENDFYKTEEDFEIAMRSAYATLHTLYGPESAPSFFGELMSDDAFSNNNVGTVNDIEAFETHKNMLTTNSFVKKFWNSYYESMFVINNVLAKLEGTNIENKAQFQGEARFLRALIYFDMVRVWGDIPFVTSPLSPNEAYALGRTPKADVYSGIIEDLKFAADNLPGKASERFVGAATSDAANVLLGKVYLTMGDKTDATTYLSKEYGKFKLISNYAKLWDKNNKNCDESIFEIQYKGGSANPYSLYWAYFSPLQNGILTNWGLGENQVTDDLWNAFENNDPRREASIQNGFKSAEGDIVSIKFPIKWRDDEAEVFKNVETSDNNFIVLRYADVLLMLSEATGDVKYLNEVRDRAGLPRYGSAGYPSAYNTLALALEHENQVEFGCEFHRWFDLIRTGRTDIIKTSSKHISSPITLLPIPQEVIDQNPNIMKQNPEY